MRTIPVGHYKVFVEERGSRAPVVDLDWLANALPHGSGIDGDYHLTVNKNGTVMVRGEYHRMNENGFYDGWVPFRFVIRRVEKPFLSETTLRGPFAGYAQRKGKRGEVYTTELRARRELVEYLQNEVDDALAERVKLLTYWTVESATGRPLSTDEINEISAGAGWRF